MPENDQEFEQGYSDRRSADRQRILDDVTSSARGAHDRRRGPILLEGFIGGETGPPREVAPDPGFSRKFSNRPEPKDTRDRPPGLERDLPPSERDPSRVRETGPVLESGQRLFDKFFENFRDDLLQRVDPHQGITADNYDFEALWLNPELKEQLTIEPFFGKLRLPESLRVGEPAKLPPAQILESVKTQRNQRLERGEIGALSAVERKRLFDRLDSFLNEPQPALTTKKDIEKFTKDRAKDKRRKTPELRQDPSSKPGKTEQVVKAGIEKIASRVPKAIRAGGDAIRQIEIPGGTFPDGKPFTAGDLFKVFGVNELVNIPKVKEPKIDDAVVDIASEFLAIAVAFLLLKGGGASGVNAPLLMAEIGTLDIEQNFANMIRDLDPEAQSLILDTLVANPDDSDFEKLGKALITDVAMPSALANAVVLSLQAFKRAGGLRALQNEKGSIELGPSGAGKGGIDPQKDSLFAAIGKLGGMDREDVIRLFGIDPKEKINSGVFGKPFFRKKGKGKDVDQMTEALGEAGYLTPDANGKFDFAELEEKFQEELSGNKQFHLQKGDDIGAQSRDAEIERLQDFKENVEFQAAEDLKAQEAFERANVEAEEAEFIGFLDDALREIVADKTIPAGERLVTLIENTQIRPVSGGAPGPKGSGKKFGEQAIKKVGKILKGETEQIPEEVVKRIAGLQGRHIDIGGRLSINWSIVPERLKGSIKVVREIFEKEIEEGVPIVKEADTVLAARRRIEADLDGEIFKFMGRDFDATPASRVDTVIGNWIADDAALQVYKLQEATIEDVPGASFEFLKMLAVNADVQKQRQLMSASSSRAFKANSISPELTGVPFETRDYAKQAAEYGTELPPGVDAKVIALRMKNTVASPEAQDTFNRQASDAMTRGTFSGAFMEYWINSLLSGPQTQAVNFASNSAFAAWQIPERMLAAGISKVFRTEDGVRISESVAQLHGAVEGITDGYKLMFHNLNRTLNPLKLGDVEVSVSQKLETARKNSITSNALNRKYIPLLDEDGLPNTLGAFVDYGGEVIRAPGKMLMTFDEWFKGIGYRMELRAQAKRFASQQLDDGVDEFAGRVAQQETAAFELTGKEAAAHIRKRQAEILRDPTGEIRRFYQSVIDNPPPWIRAKAVDAATYQTFTNEMGQVGQKATALLNSHALFRLFVPFFRTPLNILSRQVERTPVALLHALRKKGAERDIALARITMGTSAMVWAFNAAAKGQITGNGPKNYRAKAWLISNGWQPNSLVTFDDQGKKVYTSISRADPFAFWLTMAADMQRLWGYLDDEERQDLGSAAVLALRNNILSKTWFRGIAEASTAMEFNDPGKFVAKFAGSLVPNLGATFEREREGFLKDTFTKDPTAGIGTTSEATTNLKEALGLPDSELDQPKGTHPSLILFERVLRKMKTRVPWWDDEGAVPDYDIWGETRVLTGGWGPDIISPFWQSFEKGDNVAKEFIENKVAVGAPGDTIMGVRLTPTEKWDYTVLAGNGLKSEALGGLGARDYLKRFIKSEEYKALSSGKDSGRSHMLRSILLSFRQDAAKMMIAKNPRLQRALSIKLSDKNTKLTGKKVDQEAVLQEIQEQILNLEVR